MLKEIFNQFDETNDGKLELKEIQKGLRKVFGDVKGSLKVFEDIMLSLDKNCNGLIDYTEFLTAASDKIGLLTEKNLKFAFNMIDKDGNG
jgi:calcium-dependent protein kinase